MKIVLLGPPGAGKGTQAKEIAGVYQVEHISTGDIFRDLIKNNSPLGVKVKKIVESGVLISDDIVIEVVVDKIKRIDLEKGFILDGFPRTLNQALIFDKTIAGLNISLNKVLYFKTSQEIIIKRLSNRRICRNCATNYNLVNLPPRKPGICDLCGGELYQRKDDKPETILKRLQIYEQQTEDLIAYYRNKDILETIDGGLDKDEAFRIVKPILEEIAGQ